MSTQNEAALDLELEYKRRIGDCRFIQFFIIVFFAGLLIAIVHQGLNLPWQAKLLFSPVIIAIPVAFVFALQAANKELRTATHQLHSLSPPSS